MIYDEKIIWNGFWNYCSDVHCKSFDVLMWTKLWDMDLRCGIYRHIDRGLGKWIETWIEEETWTWVDWDMKHWLRLGHGHELRHETLVETWTWTWIETWNIGCDLDMDRDLVFKALEMYIKTWIWNMEKFWDMERSKYGLWLGHGLWHGLGHGKKWIETWKYGDIRLRHGLRCGLIHGKIKTWVETWTWIETWKINAWRDGLRHGHGSRSGKLMHGGMAWDMGCDTWTWIETWIWDAK